MTAQRRIADIKKASRPFHNTIPDVQSVRAEKSSALRIDTDISLCIQYARLPSYVHSQAIEDGYKTVASFLKAALVLLRHSPYSFSSKKDFLFTCELASMRATYAQLVRRGSSKKELVRKTNEYTEAHSDSAVGLE